jgi:hypothetical protein
MLAKLRGWEYYHDIQGYTVWEGGKVIYDGTRGQVAHEPLDLHDPVNMALAAKVKQWAFLNPRLSDMLHWWGEAMTSLTIDNHTRHAPRWWILEASGNAQRAWLDKILSLAIEAGMVDSQPAQPHHNRD